MQALLEDVQQYRNAYHYERAQRLSMSTGAIFYALRRQGISRKKHPKACEQAQKRFKNKVAHWQSQQRPVIYVVLPMICQERMVIVTEAHCFSKKGWGAKGRTKVIGALRGKTLLCSCLLACNVDREVFHCWVTQQLLPLSPSNAVIVMDNATFHKRSDTLQAITQAGLTLEFLPPYSPQLNPIEKRWAKAKAIRKRIFSSIFELFNLHIYDCFKLI